MSGTQQNRPTTASLLTPVGRGAIATVVVAGPGALDAVARLFQPLHRATFESAPLRRAVLGRWQEAHGEEIVACRIAHDEIELHCHGGPVAAQRILDDLAAAGVAIQTWQRLLAEQTASDAWRRAAIEALTAATTERAALVLLDQAQGALQRELMAVEQEAQRGDLAAARQRLEALHARAELGRHLTSPWRVAIFGRPNVGKSSLLNALAGYQRAIAYDQPGTTRDAVTVATALDGWPVELVDTAGLHATDDQLEQAGMALARAALNACDLALFVRDRSQAWSPQDQQLLSEWPAAVAVHNKCDLAPASDSGREPPGILVSCRTGEGLADLQAAIAARLAPQPPPAGAGVPITAEQQEAVRQAAAALAAGRPLASLASPC